LGKRLGERRRSHAGCPRCRLLNGGLGPNCQRKRKRLIYYRTEVDKQLPSNGQVMADGAEEPEGGWSERGPIRWPVVIYMTEHGACLPRAMGAL